MKYFAKYFPKIGGFSRSVKDANGVPYDFEQEVELCLCEVEIKVGSEALFGILRPKNPNWKKITEVGDDYIRIEGDPDMLDLHSCQFKNFTKVGPISKDATWVKEGDEFDETQVSEENFAFSSDPNPDEFTVWFIKGPCGHFH